MNNLDKGVVCPRQEEEKAPTSYISVWTMQMGKWRLAKDKGIFVLDITAKSGVTQFAPDFNNVFLYKRGEMSESVYTEAYLQRMAESQQQYPKHWMHLKTKPHIALACYCKPNVFCHRHLFKRLMKEYLYGHGYAVVDEGELV